MVRHPLSVLISGKTYAERGLLKTGIITKEEELANRKRDLRDFMAGRTGMVDKQDMGETTSPHYGDEYRGCALVSRCSVENGGWMRMWWPITCCR